MNRPRWPLFIGMFSTGMLLGGCGSFGREPHYNYRMTVEVETPQGLRAGSSVMKINAYKETFVVGDRGGGHSGVAGEAVVVDLPSGPIFVLLKRPSGSSDLHSDVTKALAPEARSGSFDDYLAAVKKLGHRSQEVKAELPRDRWPMMVRFGNINDPKTVEEVDPDVAGVRHIRLETTTDPVTTGIEQRLAWLPAHHGALVYDPRSQAPDRDHPERNLNQEAFKIGPAL